MHQVLGALFQGRLEKTATYLVRDRLRARVRVRINKG